MRPRCERSPLPRPANDAIFCLALAQERRMRRGIERHSRTRNRSSEENCCQISGRWQANLAQHCHAAKSCGSAARDSLLHAAMVC
jgi:hypothetical protein